MFIKSSMIGSNSKPQRHHAFGVFKTINSQKKEIKHTKTIVSSSSAALITWCTRKMNASKVLVATALAVITLQFTFVAGMVYTVGAPKGLWDLYINYTEWASHITFYTGDSLIFTYDYLAHDVWEVTKSDYEACDNYTTAFPLKKYRDDGNTFIALTETGPKYFICSTTDHCARGMKLAIIVNAAISTPTYNPPPPTGADNSHRGVIIPITVVFSVLLIFVVIAVIASKRWKKTRRRRRREQVLPNLDVNRKFSYNDLKKITNGFKNSIGVGGYGHVYSGILQNGIKVAVKMRSESSSQGENEFLAEAENLARVHHRNLVSLMGYCIDKNCMALVYEYMQEGNLYDKIRDDASPLDWKQRLRIAYESALGLKYLHKACNPPLIHRDVKTSNILLGANLEAKISDFGLSKPFNSDVKSHVTTKAAGTFGYMDPEYYISNKLKAKSDVYSFGVVLLEIITGRSPVSANLEGCSLVSWVRRHLSEGNIEGIVDPKMQNQYDINSVWKVADLACKCTEHNSSKRPTMSDVVTELYESLNLEVPMEETRTTEISQNSLVGMAYIDDMSIQQVPV